MLIGQGQLVASRIAAGYAAAKTAWSDQRGLHRRTRSTTINSAAQHIASLNKAILQTTTSGGNANELMDQRDTALTSLAQLDRRDHPAERGRHDRRLPRRQHARRGERPRARSRSRERPTSPAPGATRSTSQWTDSRVAASRSTAGRSRRQLATLAGPSGGTGGIYAETAEVYNDLATALADDR